jgi:hypothetical protein
MVCDRGNPHVPGKLRIRPIVGWVAGVLACLPHVGSAEPESHLRFFRQNRDFILRAFEALPRAPAGPADSARAWAFDPFAAGSVQERVRAVRAALDTASAPEHLGAFHDALGALLDDVGAAGTRLDDLDSRFRAHLRTSMEVTLAAAGPGVERVEAWIDGEPAAEHVLAEPEKAALAAGGVLEVLRRVAEPRTQNLEVRVWLAGRSDPVRCVQTVSPVLDALVCVRLDLDGANAPIRVHQTTLEAHL